ncbi:jg9460 [Pararge aegeria aegeria]|uniref:Jg9460 protein n=1 Tax=Pararge aegeria aegeria TaxID=348720 RepID=A0A8S4RIC2_9NEOP|nr:jg9460 [Pararge aegeria aegeria]
MAGVPVVLRTTEGSSRPSTETSPGKKRRRSSQSSPAVMLPTMPGPTEQLQLLRRMAMSYSSLTVTELRAKKKVPGLKDPTSMTPGYIDYNPTWY